VANRKFSDEILKKKTFYPNQRRKAKTKRCIAATQRSSSRRPSQVGRLKGKIYLESIKIATRPVATATKKVTWPRS